MTDRATGRAARVGVRGLDALAVRGDDVRGRTVTWGRWRGWSMRPRGLRPDHRRGIGADHHCGLRNSLPPISLA